MYLVSTLWVYLFLITKMSAHNAHQIYDPVTGKDQEYATIEASFEECERQILSMFNAYRSDRLPSVIETNEVKGTNYRTWKRNADLINSLLALPIGMNAAGR